MGPLPSPTFPMFPLKPTSPPFSPLLIHTVTTTSTPTSSILPSPRFHPNPSLWRISSTSSSHHHAATVEVDMVKNQEGIWSAKPKKVVVLWDLDNKPPRGPPYQAAMALKNLAQLFGDLVEISAYANRHAFVHLPQWVVDQRRERRRQDGLERKGLSTPTEPYVCSVCGRKCRTHLDLKKHFKQLHERERQKKLNRMRSLKGKKRQRYKERFISGNSKYEEAARDLITPKLGYGLASELRRAGVFVKTVEDKPQAADWAVKKQMQHSMSRGIDWMFLVSDDSDFSEMLRRARDCNLRTVVVGDWDRALGRHADLWVPWSDVENGEIGEEELFSGRRNTGDFSEDEDADDGLFSVSSFDGRSNLDEIVGVESRFEGLRISAFSEGEEEEEAWIENGLENEIVQGHLGNLGPTLSEKDLFWDSEESEDEDGYF